MADDNQPIIVKRVKRYAAGHHGGAWKIAFADFATAMMAFFLVLWLMSSATPEQKKAIAGYFQDPIGFTESASPFVMDLGGTPTPSPQRTLNPEVLDENSPGQLPEHTETDPNTDKPKNDTERQGDPNAQRVEQAEPQVNAPKPEDSLSMTEKMARDAEALAERVERERLELLLQELQNKIEQDTQLRHFKEQILFDITQDGLRVQIRDAENRPMFSLGSAQLQPYFEDILLALSETLRSVPNKISISGHTDAKPFAGGGQFGNWELSANRANAARRALQAGGYPEAQIARVMGYSSMALFNREDPLDPVNRRIDILVMTKKAQRAVEAEQAPTPGHPASAPRPAGAPGAMRSDEVLDRLNKFQLGTLDVRENKP